VLLIRGGVCGSVWQCLQENEQQTPETYAECPTRARGAREKVRRRPDPRQRGQTAPLSRPPQRRRTARVLVAERPARPHRPRSLLRRPGAPARTALEQVQQQPLQLVTVQQRAAVERLSSAQPHSLSLALC
jgi:hypothetical protein